VEKKDPVPVYLGLRNEVVRENAKLERFISVIVRGIRGVPDGEYKLAWSQGMALKHYLSQLKLVSTAIRSAVRDLANPEAGRLRMHYIPAEGARIALGNPAVSSALQFQRSSHNAESVARDMGDGARFVDVPLPRK
jgi:hypothetical protein